MAGERDNRTTKTQVKAGRGSAPAKTTRVGGGRSAGRAGGAGNTWAEHGPELLGLAAFGLAVFLTFVLVAGERGGVIGDLAGRGLAVALGRLAFLVPVGLAGAAVLLIFEVRPHRRGTWTAGLILLSAGLLLVVSAGFPPLGEAHGAAAFQRAAYRLRAGWLGEVLWVGGVRLVGEVGVALAGWLFLVAGVSLLSGLTVRRVLLRTGRAAQAVGTEAQDRARRLRGRRSADGENREAGPLDDPYLSGFGPRPAAGSMGSGAPEGSRGSLPESGAQIDGWEQDPWEVPAGVAPRHVDLVDGAAAFPDIYGEASAGVDEARPPGVGEADGSLPAGGKVAGGEAAGAGAAGTDGVETDGRPGSAGGSASPPVASGGTTEAESAPYKLPTATLLKKSAVRPDGPGRGDRETAALLVETLTQFGVEATVVGMVVGPRVTRFELQLAPGTKVSKVSGLKDDLAYALASTEIRILAPIPGKQAVGVEVPNHRPSFVTLGDIYRDFPVSAGPLMVWLGKDISGKPVYTDLAKLPHLLIAGTTGSGKSGCVNCIISSILLRATPDTVKLILIDPKKVELSHYDRIPHLLVPVVTNMKNAAGVLHNVVKEMESRYELMDLEKARHLDEANKARTRRGEKPLPYIVIVIDELADLMMVSPAEVEEYIIRLAQKARAVGIHLVVATQRPSVDVITGMIKANIPSRIAFAVSSQTDSRVILDTNGAETLLGMGDMLFKPLGSRRLQRVQGAYITEEEIQQLVTHVRRQARPEYREELLEVPETSVGAGTEGSADPDRDELLADAAELVLDTGSASVSMLQRRLRVGYTRAGRLIDMLERRGVVGPYEGSKPRQITVRPEEREKILETLRAECAGGQVPLPLDLEET